MKTLQVIIVTLVLSIALFVPGTVQAFSFDLYNTTNNTENGTLCGICPILELPEDVYGGYVVLLDAMGDLLNPTTWRNVVIFGETVIAGILQGTTDLGDPGRATVIERLCFGDLNRHLLLSYLRAGDFRVLRKSAATPPVTFYDAYIVVPGDSNKYYIHEVPEPSSLLLLGSGLTALGLWRRLKVRKEA